MSANAAAVNVTNTNTGSQGHGTLSYSNNGYGLLGESTHNQGVVARTHSNSHWGLVAQNVATTYSGEVPGTNPGGAIHVDGGKNIGILTSGDVVGIHAYNSAHGVAILAEQSGTPGDGFAIQANGGQHTAIWATNQSEKPVVSAQSFGVDNSPVIVGLNGSNAAQMLRDFMGDKRGAGEFAGNNGVIGAAAATFGVGVAGGALASQGWGLYGYGVAGAYALVTNGKSEMDGDLRVFGTLTKSGGSFKIDHPLDPANKYLYHSFVESPDMKNVYDGVATADAHGAATVELPDWFETLNRDFRYQLTALDGAAPELHVSKRLHGNRFSIGGAKPGQDVSWQLTGIRHDSWANDHRIPVEETKPKDERGTYLYPEGFGKPASAGLAARISPHPH